ncbi:MAG: hypothetical protein M0R16_08970 [Bacteroidales bacterium]|jgi:predicted GTPase|nr:hypothetical protein [Bacteroidales bacterium]
MKRADKIEILKLIKEGKFNADWLNIQYVVEQPDGSITINGKPIELAFNDKTTDPLIKKYIQYDWSGVSEEALKKLIDKYREQRDEQKRKN